MLEIPESNTVAGQINQAIGGKRILSAIAGAAPHGFAFFTGEPAEYGGRLQNRVVERAVAVAGQLELQLGELRLVFNDGVNLRYLAPDSPRPAKHQLLLELEDGSAMVCTVQMYAGIHLFRDGENDNFYYLVAKEKPSPLTDGFDTAYFGGILSETKPALSAKALLATEQRIPGLGNGCLQDILFRAGVHPKTKVRDMDSAATDALYHSVRDTLRLMTDGGGRDTEKDLYGNSGRYRSILSKNTLAYPCLQCGGGLTKQAYLGGAVYFCPVCQPLK